MDELDESVLGDAENSVAFHALQEYQGDGLITPDDVKKFKEVYKRLNCCVLDVYSRQKELMKKAKMLNNDLLSEKIKLEKQSIRKSEEVALINNLEKEKDKAAREVAECSERESALTYTVAELQREYAELLTQRDTIMKETASQIEPEIRALTDEIASLDQGLKKVEDMILSESDRQKESTEKIQQLEDQQNQADAELANLRQSFSFEEN